MLDPLQQALLALIESASQGALAVPAWNDAASPAISAAVHNACFAASAFEGTSSPIERLLMCSMAQGLSCYSDHARFCFHDDERHRLVVVPQAPVDKWRADFLVIYRLPRTVYLAIECDGHDFHERTKEQARHDRSRDRAFLAKGIKTVRFTGSEIYADSLACVLEISELLQNEFDMQCLGWKGVGE